MADYQLLLAVLLVVVGVCHVAGYGSGAPTSICKSMLPSHGSRQTSTSPYNIHVSEDTYFANGHIIVAVTGTTYSGLMLQARRTGGNKSPVGHFVAVAPNTKLMKCDSDDDSVTHSSTASKSDSATYTWVGPQNNAGKIQFVATVASSKNTWWTEVKSGEVQPSAAYPTNPPNAATNITSCVSIFVFVGGMLGLILYDRFG